MKDPKNKHKFIVDKNAADVVRKIFRMVLDGKSKTQIVDDLNDNGVLPPALYKIKKLLLTKNIRLCIYGILKRLIGF